MNQKLKELLMRERVAMTPSMLGLGDEPDAGMAKDALSHPHHPIDWSKCQDDCHAPSKVASRFSSAFLPIHLKGIASHEYGD